MIVNSEYNEKTGAAKVVIRGKHGDISSGKARFGTVCRSRFVIFLLFLDCFNS